jgi:hypothetical protein
MNLGKLLGAGKSFFGGGGNVAYRENKRIYLPKFNAEKNPFAPKPADVAPVAAPEAKKVSTPVAAKTQKIPVFAAQQPKPAMPTRVVSWKDKLNPFRSPEPVAPPMANAVQVELSLESVKVVHNDLADADIEVVPVKSRTISQPEAPMLPPARQSWEFLGERLVKQS